MFDCSRFLFTVQNLCYAKTYSCIITSVARHKVICLKLRCSFIHLLSLQKIYHWLVLEEQMIRWTWTVCDGFSWACALDTKRLGVALYQAFDPISGETDFMTAHVRRKENSSQYCRGCRENNGKCCTSYKHSTWKCTACRHDCILYVIVVCS